MFLFGQKMKRPREDTNAKAATEAVSPAQKVYDESFKAAINNITSKVHVACALHYIYFLFIHCFGFVLKNTWLASNLEYPAPLRHFQTYTTRMGVTLLVQPTKCACALH